MRQQQQQQQQQGRIPTEYAPGTTVFAKLKGYPWWPARIEPDHAVPPKVLKQKSKAKGALYTVFFYGSRDYGFFGPDAIRPFDNESVENDLKAKKFKTKDLELAVRQALNPSLLTQLEDEEKDEDEEDEEGEDEEDTKKTKGAKKDMPTKKKTSVPVNNKAKKTKQTESKLATAAKRRSRKVTLGDEEAVDETAVGESLERKRRRKSMSLEKDEEGRDSPVAQEQVDNKEDVKKTPEYKKVYHIRHRLQRLVYNKKEGEIPKEDYSKILQIVKEIEEAPMTYNLLKDTKIGKVVKAACSYPFEDDTVIRDRCQQLMRNWKVLLIDPQTGMKPHEDTHMHHS
ncbi:hypothetical protein BD560DRAFT_386082 [Blakeslea trispora]|nr:hypothetical protein BD560DRAFT_386082 [Blakeslea trispora]